MSYLTIIPHLYTLTGASFCVFRDSLQFIYSYPNLNENDHVWMIKQIEKHLDNHHKDDIIPVCLTEGTPVYLYLCSIGDTIITVGPISHSILTPFEAHSFHKNYRLPDQDLIMCSRNSILAAISILMTSLGSKLFSNTESENILHYESNSFEPEANPSLQQINHINSFQLNHSYAAEKYFFNLVKAGDVEKVIHHINNGTILYPTPITSSLKNEEYMVISLISLLCRVAIEGNVPPTVAYSQSDALLKQVSKNHSISEYKSTARDAAVLYTNLVKRYETLGIRSLLSIKCQKLIHSGLFENITLSSISAKLGVSKEHLSTCFKNDFGITVTQYIHTKKSELACEILSSSDYTVNEIAAYLSFNSTSYFIKIFKRYIGVSPIEYRKNHTHV